MTASVRYLAWLATVAVSISLSSDAAILGGVLGRARVGTTSCEYGTLEQKMTPPRVVGVVAVHVSRFLPPLVELEGVLHVCYGHTPWDDTRVQVIKPER